MSKYLLVRGLLHKGELVDAGQIVELDDQEQIKKLLDRGTIVEAKEGVEVAPRLSAFEQAQSQNVAADAQDPDRNGEQAAKEEAARAAIDARRAELAASVGATAPAPQVEATQPETLTPSTEPASTLTPEQVAQDFQDAGVETSPNVPPQQ